MLCCQEQDGTIPRTVVVVIKPTPTEVADAIWNLSTDEQIMLLGCLKRRFCDKEEGLLQIADVARELSNMPTKKSEAKTFVKCLADYVLSGGMV